MHSCIYEGWVRHRRFQPVAHEFRNKLFLMYLDLSELDDVFRGRLAWSTRRLAIARFKRSDHFGDPSQTLDESVRQFIEQAGHPRPTGGIRMLAHLRYFGYVLNPISLFYCFDSDASLQYVVAEVTNTPWGERHCYLVPRDQFAGKGCPPSCPKSLHVSPFMPMDVQYGWQITTPTAVPGSPLTVQITNHKTSADSDSNTEPNTDSDSDTECVTERAAQAKPFFDATLSLKRREISTWQLSRMLLRFPLMTAQVAASIYWQAIRLWWKGCPFYSHPKTNAAGQTGQHASPFCPASRTEPNTTCGDEQPSISTGPDSKTTEPSL